MTNDETIAALERFSAWIFDMDMSGQAQQDTLTIRALIDTLRNGGERAKIVAYANRKQIEWQEKTAQYRAAGNHGPYLGEPSWADFARCIASGAHLK